MRTPSILCDQIPIPTKNDSQNQNQHQRQIPLILNRCLKRRSSDVDLSQPQTKSIKKLNNIYNNYSSQHLQQHQQQHHQQPQQQQQQYHITQIHNHNNIISHQSPTIEFVNVMFDQNLLPIQNSIISEANSVNLNDLTATWNSSDLLDLDQKNYDDEMRNDLSKIENSNQPTEDLEDKNLSWLFNFKLDELPHLSPEVNRSRSNTGKKVDQIIQEATSGIEGDDLNIAENLIVENIVKLPKKPPFTYTELIEYALEDRGELTVSGIYQWISDRFPFYKSNDDRWKNSVRHNLSINPHFRKGSKAPQGAGHLWTISSRESENNILAWEHKKQRLELFFKMEANSMQNREIEISTPPVLYEDEAAAAAASISLSTNNGTESPEPSIHIEDLQLNYSHQPNIHIETANNEDLRRTAGEILNGVRRNVEVQLLNQPINNNFQAFTVLESDYLNPVSKDEIVQECGLRSTGRHEIGSDYFVTEIDPIELGINMSANGDDEVLFGDDFNLNYFGIGPGSNIMA